MAPQMTLSRLLLALQQQKGGPAGGRPIAGPMPGLAPSQTLVGGHPANLSPLQQQAPHTLATALAQVRAAHTDPHQVLDSSHFKPDPNVVPEGLTEFKAKYGDSPGGWEAAYERRQKRLALGIHLGPDGPPVARHGRGDAGTGWRLRPAAPGPCGRAAGDRRGAASGRCAQGSTARTAVGVDGVACRIARCQGGAFLTAEAAADQPHHPDHAAGTATCVDPCSPAR
jgi:hypothetical protein